MTELKVFSRYRRARVWIDELPDLARPEAGSVLTRRLPAHFGTNTRSASAAIEIYIPRGPRAEYGLLGGTFDPSYEATLEIRVLTFSGIGQVWPPALVSALESAHIGLPDEFGQSVVAAAERAMASLRPIPAGLLSLSHSANGPVTSSASLFGGISSILSTYLVRGDATGATLWSAIEELLSDQKKAIPQL